MAATTDALRGPVGPSAAVSDEPAAQAPAGSGSVAVEGDLTGSQVGIGGKVVQIQADGFATVLFVDGTEVARAERRPLARSVQARKSLVALGRERELARLADAVDAAEPVQVYGPSGVGKTTLLLHATGRGTLGTAAVAPEGTVLLSARGLPTEEVLQEVFLATYQVAGLHLPAQAERRSLLAALRVLVVLDDLDCSAEELADLVHALPHCVVVTASGRMNLTGGCTVGLRGLPLPAALTLFQDALGRPLTDEESAQAEQAWLTTDGHPGRLGLVAAYLREAAEHGIPPEVPPADGLALLVPKLVAWLSTAATGLLRHLAVAGDTEWGAPLVTALPGGTAAVVEELVRARLLVQNETRLHLAEGVAAGLGENPDGAGLPAVAEAVADWLARSAPADAAAEVEVVTALVQRAADAGLDTLVTRLARAGAPRLMLGLRWRAWGRLLDAGLHAAQRSKLRDDEAYFTHESGIRALCLGDVAKAAVLLSAAAALGVRGGEALRELLSDPPAPPDPGTAVAQHPSPPSTTPPSGPWHHGLLTGKALLAAAAAVAAATLCVNAFGGEGTSNAGPSSSTGPLVTDGHTREATAPTRSAASRGPDSGQKGGGGGHNSSSHRASGPSTAESDPWKDFPFGGRRVDTTVYADGFRYDVVGALVDRDTGGQPQLLLTATVRNELTGPSSRRLENTPTLQQGGRRTVSLTDTTSAGREGRRATFTFPLYQGFRWEDAQLEFPAYADDVTTLPLVPGGSGGPLVAHAPYEVVIGGKLRNTWMELTVIGGQYRTDVALDAPGDMAPKLRAGRAGLLLTFAVEILDAPPGGVGLRAQDFDVVQPDGTRLPFEVGTDFGGFTKGRTPQQQYIAVQVTPAAGTYTLVFTHASQDAGTSGGPEDSLSFTVRK
ncbi:ATP-binding protein [Streptomyces sp. NPDC002685]|uniref:ATP-binding protein n=1 Tax=Streptomyces sp. NPDC002685 TaxID=3154540 RepID=UPI00331E2E77